MSTEDTVTLLLPDDFHHHLRDGEVLAEVTRHACGSFGRVLAMPNIKPPVRTVAEALAYKERILAAAGEQQQKEETSIELLMTLYLTDQTSAEEIALAKASGVVKAVKLYPAGATTNSEMGVTSMEAIKPALQALSDLGMPLLVHGEVTTPSIDIFDREAAFIETVLKPMLAEFPLLKIVMEHITTADAVAFVSSCGDNVAATITCHHLLYNRSDIFKGGVCPHLYCLPILKRERHRLALLEAATSGNAKFFLGTDSAPHALEAKQSACGCAGVFTGHAALELYAEAFDSIGKLHMLEGFASKFGAAFYQLPENTRQVRLIKESWTVPESYPFGSSVVRPLRAGEAILWKRER